MKLYNNSQKTPQRESLHKVEQNCKTPRQKMKVYTANITVSSPPPPASDMAGKNTPNSFYEITEKSFHAQNTQAGSWYTQRQLGSFYSIRFLYFTQLCFPKVGVASSVSLQTISLHRELKVEGSITRVRFGRKSVEERHRAAGDGF